MLQRLRRPAAALSAAVLVTALGACADSSDDSADDTSSSSESSSESASADESGSGEASGEAPPTGEVEGVTFSGAVGEGITAEWSAEIPKPEETTLTTVVAGDGEAVAEGDTVQAFLWVGNGTSQEQVYSDYDNGQGAAIPNDDQLTGVFKQLLSGATYGSRVAAVTNAAELFGADAENNSLGVGPDDSLVVVADLVEKQAVAPTPTSEEAEDASPDTQPTVVEEGGQPVGLDFEGIEEPALDTPVQRVVLEEGDGAEVTAESNISVNYLGSTYDADAPFDESYSRGTPLDSPLSGLIQGWTIGLEGVKVGSRVLLQIPPAFGYGAQGSGANIPGNATLWFVIDVISAA